MVPNNSHIPLSMPLCSTLPHQTGLAFATDGILQKWQLWFLRQSHKRHRGSVLALSWVSQSGKPASTCEDPQAEQVQRTRPAANSRHQLASHVSQPAGLDLLQEAHPPGLVRSSGGQQPPADILAGIPWRTLSQSSPARRAPKFLICRNHEITNDCRCFKLLTLG